MDIAAINNAAPRHGSGVQMTIQVDLATDIERWELELCQFPHSPFLSTTWLLAIASYGPRAMFFRLLAQGSTVALAAGLELAPRHSLLQGLDRVLFFYAPPALSKSYPHLAHECIDALVTYARRNGYTALQIRSWGAPFAPPLNSTSVKPVSRVEYVVDLSHGADAAAAQIRSSSRRKVRRAEDQGLHFYEASSPELTGSLIRLLEETKAIRKQKGLTDYTYFYMPFVNAGVVEQLLRKGFAKITWIRDEKQVLSAYLLIIDGGTAYYFIGGTNRHGYSLNANSLMVAKQIAWLSQLGITELNLGGTPKGAAAEGLHKFKTSMGAQVRECVHGDSRFLQGPVLWVFSSLLRRVRGWSYSFHT
jgi:hypothetical protein